MNQYDATFEEAFWTELTKMAAAGQIDDLTKEALGLATLGQGIGQLGKSVGQGIGAATQGIQHAAFGKLIPTGVQGAHGAGEMMLRKGGLFGGLMGAGHQMEQAGMNMRSTMAQRVAQAPGLSAAARATSPSEMAEIGTAAKAMGTQDPGTAARIGSHVVESTGHHIAHASPVQLAAKSIGIPLGGALEGLARGSGRELRSSGNQLAQRAGGVLERNAKGIGRVGELAGVPAMAMGLHAPLSAAGLIGGKLIGSAMPAAEHMIEHAGPAAEYAHHAASDLVGNIAQRGASFKAKFLGNRLGGRAGQAMNGLGDALA